MGINNAESQSEPSINETALPRYSFDMSEIDLNNSIWQLSNRDAWDNTTSGIIALSDGARLIEQSPRILSNNGFDTVYTITADIRPATALNTDYWLLFSIGDETAYAAYFQAETLAVNQVALYRFDAELLSNSAPLSPDSMTIIQRTAANSPLTSQTQLSVQVDADSVSILINDDIILEATNLSLETGAIGVQLPAQASLSSISVDN